MTHNGKLRSAPVQWTIGQALLPEHFQAQERHLRDEILVRVEHLGLPRFGVARLVWDEGQIERGVVSISDLTLALPNGTILDIPGNCEATSFDLESTGQSHVPLFIAPVDPASLFALQKPPPSLVEKDPSSVAYVVQKVRLVGSRTAAPEAETFHLASFGKDVSGGWRLDTAYIPPTLGIRETPFYPKVVERLAAMLERFHVILVEDVRDNYLAGNLLLSAQQTLREVFRLKGVLSDLSGALDPHPYELFRMLRDLYIDICIYRKMKPVGVETPYEHGAIGPSLERIFDAIEPLLATPRAGRIPYTPFEKREGVLVCLLPPEARRSHHVFLLVQKSSVGEDIEFERAKLASPTRLPVVHQRALRGIPFKRIDQPPFHHDFTSEVEFYALELTEEWDYGVNEGAVATYERAEYARARLFLYWR